MLCTTSHILEYDQHCKDQQNAFNSYKKMSHSTTVSHLPDARSHNHGYSRRAQNVVRLYIKYV